MQYFSLLNVVLVYTGLATACSTFAHCKCLDTRSGKIDDAMTELICEGTIQGPGLGNWDAKLKRCNYKGAFAGINNCEWRQRCNKQSLVTDWETSNEWLDSCEHKL
ncbi:putative transporter [Teratosphaeria destructans]|uniref:Transporter n=1 Tax=Teratosphaeria destructans TaxID=418781 RepID=A0A9W7SYX0_9PEZI|nr:putative transporter [Teratosphaeria destructans]